MELRRPGPYQVQAAIAALHGEATAAAETDWAQIAALYARLLQMQPTPVVALNRAAAVAMAEGPRAGLDLLADPTLAEAYAGIVLGEPIFHDGAWGMATLEVQLALMDSARERREVSLSHQIAVPADHR